jgi:hypothetical protein
VLQSISRALDLSADVLLAHAGLVDATDAPAGDSPGTDAAIRQDPHLTEDQKQALLAVYRSYVQANASADGAPAV